jgi:hypothetical protein
MAVEARNVSFNRGSGMRSSLFVITVLGLFVAMRDSYGAQQSGVAGRWEWQGEAGWQRLALDLRENRGKLTGSIVMGPGPGSSAERENFWEYFFNPAEFEITRGSVQGNVISFEQPVLTHLEYSAASTVWNKPMNFKYTGRLEGDRLVLTRELHQKWPHPLNSRNQSFEIVFNREGALLSKPAGDFPGAPQKQFERRSLVDISVKDGSGQSITTLKPQDFEVYENGQRRDIQVLLTPDDPWNIEFMFDTDAWLFSPTAFSGSPALAASGKLGAKNMWQQISIGVSAFYEALRPQDRVAVDLFDIRPVTLMDWKNGGLKGAIVAKGGVQPSMGIGASPQKDVYAAVLRMLERLRDGKGRKVAILLTDGRDGRLTSTRFVNQKGLGVIDPLFGLINRAEEKEFEQILENIRKSGVRFYIATVNANRSSYDHSFKGNMPGAAKVLAAHSQFLDTRLVRLAEVSGGAVLYRGDSAGAAALCGDIARLLGIGQTYSIEYRTGAAVADERSIEVRVRDPRLHTIVVRP